MNGVENEVVQLGRHGSVKTTVLNIVLHAISDPFDFSLTSILIYSIRSNIHVTITFTFTYWQLFSRKREENWGRFFHIRSDMGAAYFHEEESHALSRSSKRQNYP